MEAMIAWGLDVIRAVQTIESPALTAAMRAITLLGSEYFYLVALPVFFWCVDARFGLRFGAVFLTSSFLNSWLKVLLGVPRPFAVDPTVGLSHETSLSMPSGHAQGSATFWGLLGPKIKRPWGLILALAVPLLVGFTRVYLGVHYPSDVLMGWALGWGIALAWFLYGSRVEALLGRATLRAKLVLAALASLAMNALLPSDTSLSGVFLGTCLGAIMLFDKFGFDAAAGGLKLKGARLALGVLGLGAIYFGLKLAFPGEGSSLYALFRFVRYALIGAWVSLGAPWLFMHLGLAKSGRASA